MAFLSNMGSKTNRGIYFIMLKVAFIYSILWSSFADQKCDHTYIFFFN